MCALFRHLQWNRDLIIFSSLPSKKKTFTNYTTRQYIFVLAKALGFIIILPIHFVWLEQVCAFVTCCYFFFCFSYRIAKAQIGYKRRSICVACLSRRFRWKLRVELRAIITKLQQQQQMIIDGFPITTNKKKSIKQKKMIISFKHSPQFQWMRKHWVTVQCCFFPFIILSHKSIPIE